MGRKKEQKRIRDKRRERKKKKKKRREEKKERREKEYHRYGTMNNCMETMGVWNARILYRKV